MALLGAGLVATSPRRPVQDEIRRLAFRPNKAGEQPAHLGSSHGNWRATAPIPPWYSPAHLSRFPGCSGPSGAAGTVQMPRRARLQVIGDNVDTPAVGWGWSPLRGGLLIFYTSADLLCSPVAPLGLGGLVSSICGVPSASTQRTSRVWLPSEKGQS